MKRKVNRVVKKSNIRLIFSNFDQYFGCFAHFSSNHHIIGAIFPYNETNRSINLSRSGFGLSPRSRYRDIMDFLRGSKCSATNKKYRIRSVETYDFIFPTNEICKLNLPNSVLDETCKIDGYDDLAAYSYTVSFSLENTSGEDILIEDICINQRNTWNWSPPICETTNETALRIWDDIRKRVASGRTYPYLFSDSGNAISLSRFLIGYGSGACGSYAKAFMLGCARAGIPARTISLSHGSHIAAEAMINGKYLFFDPFYGCDAEGEGVRGSCIVNESGNTATYEELCEDHDLLMRAGRLRIGELASLIGYQNTVSEPWTDESARQEPVDFTLLPAERITWHALHADSDNPKRRLVEFQLSPGRINQGFSRLPYPVKSIAIDGTAHGEGIRLLVQTASRNMSHHCRGDFHVYESGLFQDTDNALAIQTQCSESARLDIKRITVVCYVSYSALPFFQGGVNEITIKSTNTSPGLSGIVRVLPCRRYPLPPKPSVNFPATLEAKDRIELENTCHYIVSKYPDCSIPAAPVMEGIGKRIEGFHPLTDNQRYYCKISVIDDAHVPGESVIYSFIYASPMRPDPGISIKDDTVELSWQTNRADAYYQIYGSRESGFHASENDYPVWVKRLDSPAKTHIYPGNSIGTVPGGGKGCFSIKASACYAHFRVAAFAGNGVSVSKQVSIPTPFIIASSIRNSVRIGEEYACFVQCITSLGQLYFNRLPDQPIYTGYHKREIPVFKLSNAPEWLSIRETDGYLHGIPNASGTFTFSLSVETHQGKHTINASISVI